VQTLITPSKFSESIMTSLIQQHWLNQWHEFEVGLTNERCTKSSDNRFKNNIFAAWTLGGDKISNVHLTESTIT